MLKKYYLSGFFWVPIPVEQYQNMSGFTGVDKTFNMVSFFLENNLNIQRQSGFKPGDSSIS